MSHWSELAGAYPGIFFWGGITRLPQDCHASLNAGWFVQGLQSPEHKHHRNIGRADAVNTVPSPYGDFVADSVLYREPVEDITEDRGDVAELQ